MNKNENIFSQILVFFFGAYIWIGGIIFIPYFNYQYAKDHGFVNWIFLGQIVPTLKAAVWPYFVYDHFNKEEWTDEQLESIVYMRQSMDAVFKVARLGEFLAEDDYSLKTFNKINGFIRDAKTPADNVDPEVLKRLNPELAEQWETKYIEGLSLFERSITLLKEGNAKEGLELAHESDRLLRAYFEWWEQAEIKWPKGKRKRVEEIEKELEQENVVPQVSANEPSENAPQVEYYANGQKKSAINFKNGKPDGPIKDWFENGQKKREAHFKNGEPGGLSTEWYENGQKKHEVYWKDGKQDGTHTVWHENGQKIEEAHFKKGEPDGLQTTWHENGQKTLESNYKNGKPDGLGTMWHENGQKKQEGNYKNGEPDGLTTVWYENGHKEREAHYKNGELDGLETEWYENGQKKLEANYNNGNPEGLWTLWYANGQKLSEAQYKDGKEISRKEF